MAEPSCTPESGVVSAIKQPPTGGIPFLREQLSRPVSTGKAKEFIGQNLTHEQLKRLTDKDVEKFYILYLREKLARLVSTGEAEKAQMHAYYVLYELHI